MEIKHVFKGITRSAVSFLEACITGDIEEMRKHSDDVNSVFTFKKGGFYFKMTPLCIILETKTPPRNIKDVVVELLSIGADPSFNDNGCNPEFFALGNEYFDIAEMLRNYISGVENSTNEFVEVEVNDDMDDFVNIISEPSEVFVSRNKYPEITNLVKKCPKIVSAAEINLLISNDGDKQIEMDLSLSEFVKFDVPPPKRIVKKRVCFYNFLHSVVKIN